MVIWNSSQLHCNFSNNSSKMRLHQFIRMLPATDQSVRKDRYSAPVILKRAKFHKIEEIKLTELGKKLVGVSRWD
jgi:hypothetical protein